MTQETTNLEETVQGSNFEAMDQVFDANKKQYGDEMKEVFAKAAFGHYGDSGFKTEGFADKLFEGIESYLKSKTVDSANDAFAQALLRGQLAQLTSDKQDIKDSIERDETLSFKQLAGLEDNIIQKVERPLAEAYQAELVVGAKEDFDGFKLYLADKAEKASVPINMEKIRSEQEAIQKLFTLKQILDQMREQEKQVGKYLM